MKKTTVKIIFSLLLFRAITILPAQDIQEILKNSSPSRIIVQTTIPYEPTTWDKATMHPVRTVGGTLAVGLTVANLFSAAGESIAYHIKKKQDHSASTHAATSLVFGLIAYALLKPLFDEKPHEPEQESKKNH